MKHLFLLAAILAAISIPNTASAVADLTQTHDPLQLMVGAPSWNYDTGWMSANLLGVGAVAVRLWVGLGGTVLNVEMNGAGKLTYPTGLNKGDLWFQGSTGSVAQDLGFEMHGQYKVTVGGTDYIGDLPYVPNTDIRLKDSKTPTPYMLGQSVTLSDTISNQNLYVYHIGYSGIFTGDIGVSISAGDQIKIDFKRINTDKAVFTVENERKEVAVTGPTLTVADIYEMLGITPTMTFTPNIIVGITVLGIPFNVTIPTFPINVPLASLLQPEYPTTPSRSITFQIPPTVTSFAINNGAAYTFSHTVALNNVCTNAPSEYLASEDSGFSGAIWLAYDVAPSFTLSGDGTKQVYFKARNVGGESEVVSDTILVSTVLPTVASRITNDTTPALSGTVPVAGCPVSITVGTQTVPAVNNGDGTWTLADNVLSALAQGTYNVVVTITDPAGNALTDSTTNELTIDLTAPTVTVNTLVTGDTTPPLSGAINDPTAAVSITVGTQTRTATNNGNGTWTLADNVLSALVQGIYNVQVTATDVAGNVGHDSTTNELTIDTTLPVVTVYTLITSDTTPALSGMINDPAASISITVGGQTRAATNNGNGTWTLADNALSALAQGVYDVQVTATDGVGNVGHDATTNELTIDTTPPVVTVNTLVTNDPTPRLTGTVSDLTATTIELLVGSQTRTATNNGDGTWTLADNALATLADNVYDVQITATDAAGNIGHDATTSELTIDTVAPTVGVNPKITNDMTPELTGPIDDPTAVVWVTVATQTLQAFNNAGGHYWIIADNRFTALPAGTYNVHVTATDPAGNAASDATTNELVIDRTAPTATFELLGPSPTSANSVAFRVTFNEPVASFTTVARTGTLASVSAYSITGTSPVYTVTVTPNDPDANGDIGIRIYGGVVTDLAGNGYAGGSSGLYTIVNWCGFTAEPHDARVYAGNWQTFTAGAGCGGSALTYQWKWRDAAMNEHNGPTGSQWLLSGVTEASRGDYWCEITLDGVPHATAAAKLEVEPPLMIDTPPAGADKTVGDSYTFSVVATGGYSPLRYQWQRNGTPIPDATDSSYAIPALLADHAGSYTVAITDDNETTVTSDPVTLNVSLGLPLAAGGILAALACVFVVTVMRRVRTQAQED